MNRIRWYGPSLVLLLTVVLALLVGPIAARRIAWARSDQHIKMVRNDLKTKMQHNAALAKLSKAFREVAESVEPSVVSVEVLSRGRPRRQLQMQDPNDLLRRFFGPGFEQRFGPQNPFEQGPGEGQGQQQGQGPGHGQGQGSQGRWQKYNPARPSGNGSGWVYDNKGHIITNNHVVEHADALRVKMNNGAEYKATVVGKDPGTDVAVIKVDASNLHPAQVAPSKRFAQTGDMVFAFGSPFGFVSSMSQGIVSATGRKLGIVEHGRGYENFIQTDAAINPGNSGGPLTNIYGEVVGMNSAIATRTGSFNGIGFAIPINMVTRVADQIIKDGSVSRGYLGVYIADLDPEMAKTFNYKGKGVLVTGATTEDSPAAKAGVKSGDIITKVNGKSVDTADHLRYRVAGLAPGSKVDLTVFRNGKTKTFHIKLGELPSNASLAQGGSQKGQQQQGKSHSNAKGMNTLHKYGIDGIDDFTRQLANRFHVSYMPGVIVTSVRQHSRADNDGVARGMVITDVQGHSVSSVDELLKDIRKFDPTKGIRLKVQIWNPKSKTFLPRFVLLELSKQ